MRSTQRPNLAPSTTVCHGLSIEENAIAVSASISAGISSMWSTTPSTGVPKASLDQ